MVMRVLYPVKYADYVEKYAQEYEVPESLVYAVINMESSFKPEAESSIGARGLMQMTPDTFDWVQTKLEGQAFLTSDALFEPDTAIRYGTYLLSMYIDEFGTEKLALCAYHAGRGKLQQWLAEGLVSAGNEELGDIPYNDTTHYVKQVLKRQKVYQDYYHLL